MSEGNTGSSTPKVRAVAVVVATAPRAKWLVAPSRRSLPRCAHSARRTKHEALSRRTEVIAKELSLRQQSNSEQVAFRLKFIWRNRLDKMRERLLLSNQCALRESRTVASSPVESNGESVRLDKTPFVNFADALLANLTLRRQFVFRRCGADLTTARTLCEPLALRLILAGRNVKATACENSLSRDNLRSGRELRDGNGPVTA